ncbi:hypothetical protein HPB49_020731 [Dermacentor silvarum]|uniref:Uncharacterized protein n=1 Tax=Dermacentor silvarum TaxID=543639 RepID=A0ACB8CT32_DERSI|nr:hypothetical protein HPB49_020731 [Dermacentor silvarum]
MANMLGFHLHAIRERIMEPSYLWVPCTKTSDVSCILLHHREAINQVLLGAGLELREDVRCAGGTRLAVTQIAAYLLSAQQNNPVKSAGFNLANDLLMSHHCVTALEVYCAACCTYQARAVLTRNPALKSLTVHVPNPNTCQDGIPTAVFTLIESLLYLEELVFKTESATLYSPVKCDNDALLAQAGRHLTTLDVRCLDMSAKYAHQFVCALIDSTTVAELAVGGCVYRAGPQAKPGKLFGDYLIRSASILKKLTLSDGPACDNRPLWKTLVAALCKMTALQDLTLEVPIGYEIFTEVTAFFAKVVIRCATLRRLLLPWPAQTYRSQFLNCNLVPGYRVAKWMEPWLNVLWKTSGLQELGIYLPGMDEAECRTLFRAVANNESLQKLVLQEVPLIANSRGSSNLMVLSRIIQEFSLGDRVCLRNLLVTFENAPEILASAQFLTVNFNSLRVNFGAQRDLDLSLACCEALTSRGTLTSIPVCCEFIYQPAFGTLLEWMAQSSTLTHVEIVACDHAGTQSFCGFCVDMHGGVVSALSKNANIARVSLVGVKVQSQHLDMLWYSAYKHRNLIEIQLAPNCRDVGTCIPNHSTSRSMESYVASWKELRQLMSKNAARVSAAAMFVLGEDTRKGARLIESLHDHPRLLELVRKGAGATEAEAQEMAQRAMRSVRDCSLRDYMTLTGVVKEKVKRLDPDSKEVHLVDLPDECWLYVRRYLEITDVVIPRALKICDWPTGRVPHFNCQF